MSSSRRKIIDKLCCHEDLTEDEAKLLANSQAQLDLLKRKKDVLIQQV